MFAEQPDHAAGILAAMSSADDFHFEVRQKPEFDHMPQGIKPAGTKATSIRVLSGLPHAREEDLKAEIFDPSDHSGLEVIALTELELRLPRTSLSQFRSYGPAERRSLLARTVHDQGFGTFITINLLANEREAVLLTSLRNRLKRVGHDLEYHGVVVAHGRRHMHLLLNVAPESTAAAELASFAKSRNAKRSKARSVSICTIMHELGGAVGLLGYFALPKNVMCGGRWVTSQGIRRLAHKLSAELVGTRPALWQIGTKPGDPPIRQPPVTNGV